MSSLLRRAREKAGLSRRHLAGVADISVQQLWNLEHGKDEPRLSTAQRLARALGVEVEELWPMREAK